MSVYKTPVLIAKLFVLLMLARGQTLNLEIQYINHWHKSLQNWEVFQKTQYRGHLWLLVQRDWCQNGHRTCEWQLKVCSIVDFVKSYQTQQFLFFLLTVAEDQPDVPPIFWTSSIKYTPVPYEENFDICSKSFIACTWFMLNHIVVKL